ncbi:1,4-dihydroxy-2-naphthoate octaprenyltransferase [candidate division KSB1 bacterium]|nr:1,4-dihydroxy-2-naphthoate octaprenyltransferase [candidate division KSB1 bacterium]
MPRAKVWLRATRPFSFTVSILPPIVGTLTAALENSHSPIHFPHMILALLGCVLAHAASNLLADYRDYQKGVDREGTFGSSGVLIEKLLQPAQVLRAAVIVYVAAGIIGIYFILTLPNGLFLLWLIALGAIFGLFYSIGPFSWKYNALGDIAVLISFGPAMSLGAYTVQTQTFSWTPILYILPLALLVDAVLHSNNLRDIENDRVAGIRTLAMQIGDQASRIAYAVLVLGAYAVTLILILFSSLPWYAALTFASVPLAVRLLKKVADKPRQTEKEFAGIDAATAQLHSVYGILFIAALLLNLWIG